ncbi:MAG: hypothetical protein Ta2B_25700 [Termitinemataceae bacterium]|nr:MAG: hypothetical protein Ta2B_25700 [Termitinemataceae bacterium]
MSALNRLADAYLNICSAGGAAPLASKPTAFPLPPAVLGDTYLNGLQLLKAAAAVFGKIKHCNGTTAALQVNIFASDTIKKLDSESPLSPDEQQSLNTAQAVLFIMVMRGLCSKLPLLISEIEKEASMRQNIITLIVDCALEPSDSFIEQLKIAYGKKYAAKEVHVKINIQESLISGYRVTLNNRREDYSLQRLLQQMADSLEHSHITSECQQ